MTGSHSTKRSAAMRTWVLQTASSTSKSAEELIARLSPAGVNARLQMREHTLATKTARKHTMLPSTSGTSRIGSSPTTWP